MRGVIQLPAPSPLLSPFVKVTGEARAPVCGWLIISVAEQWQPTVVAEDALSGGPGTLMRLRDLRKHRGYAHVVVQAVQTECHRLGGLTKTHFFSQSGGWEFQDQGTGRSGVC